MVSLNLLRCLSERLSISIIKSCYFRYRNLNSVALEYTGEGDGLLRASCPPPSGPRCARLKSFPTILSNLVVRTHPEAISRLSHRASSKNRPENFIWWRGVDSNHRRLSQQIYSLPPLATREPLQSKERILYTAPDSVNRFPVNSAFNLQFFLPCPILSTE